MLNSVPLDKAPLPTYGGLTVRSGEMTAMRQLAYGLLLILLCGCTSTSSVPYPAVTNFDDQPKARTAYMKGFRDGYRAALAGELSITCGMGEGGLIGTANEIGWMDGQLSGRVDAIHKANQNEERRTDNH